MYTTLSDCLSCPHCSKLFRLSIPVLNPDVAATAAPEPEAAAHTETRHTLQQGARPRILQVGDVSGWLVILNLHLSNEVGRVRSGTPCTHGH